MDESLLLDKSQAQQDISLHCTVLNEEQLDIKSDESSAIATNQRRKLIFLLGSGILLATAVVSTVSFFSNLGPSRYRKNFLSVNTQVLNTDRPGTSLGGVEEGVGMGTGCGTGGSCPCCEGEVCEIRKPWPGIEYGECVKKSSGGGGCFSSKTRVEVMGKGVVPIHTVNVGDSIKSRKDGTYSKVFGFHRNDSAETLFRRIYTGNNSVLEVTPTHMVFLNGMQYPIPASQVKVGDELQQLDDPKEIEQQKTVTKIDLVQHKGFYSPITEHGTVVVDGIVASNFSLRPDNKKDDSATFDKMGLIHWHGLSQVAVSPVRFICKAMWSELCMDASFHDEEGLHKYFVLLKKLRGMAEWQQNIALSAVLGIGLLFRFAEYLYDSMVGSSVKNLVDGGEASSDAILASVAYGASEKML